MHGVVNFLKPPGMTSHDAVAFVRRVAKTKRVGHTGTLDPAAAGVLPICIGQATRLVEYLQAGTKEYIAEATFGFETDTCDAVGEIVSQGDASQMNLETLRAALDPFRGTITQTPPMHSAIKIDGKKLYELAREGVTDVEIPTREVTISQLLVSRFFEPIASTQYPRAMIKIECSGGTYIRSLVRDIGRNLGCGATMTFLVRSRSGSFTIGEAFTPEEIERDFVNSVIPIVDVLGWCAHRAVINDELVTSLSMGKTATAIVPTGIDVTEARRSAYQYNLRRGRALQNGALWQRVLFINSTHSIAALAVETDVEYQYKPEKVFFLNRDE